MKELARTEQNSVLSGTKLSNRKSTTILKSFFQYRQLLLVHSHSIEWQCLVMYWSMTSLYLLSIVQEIALLNKSPVLPLKIKRFQITEMSELSKVPFVLLPSFSAYMIFRSSLSCSSLHNQHLFLLSQIGSQSSSTVRGGIKAPPTNLASSRRKLNVAVAFA